MLGIDLGELLGVGGLRDPCVVNDIVPLRPAFLQWGNRRERTEELLFVEVVYLEEVDTLSGQALLIAILAHGSPDFVAEAEGLGDEV